MRLHIFLLLFVYTKIVGGVTKHYMKAVSMAKYGNANVLKVVEIEIPKIDSKQVLVEMKAAGINPMDAFMRSGTYPVRPQLPAVLGREVSGLIKDFSSNSTKFKIGDRVFCGIFNGGYAQYVVTNEENCFPLDERLTFEQGAALFVPYFTMHRALVLGVELKSNESILIHGTYAGIGTAAIQTAKHIGAYVIATVGTSADEELSRKNGADDIVYHNQYNYMDNALKKLGNPGFNVILEYLSNADMKRDTKYLAPGGHIVGVGYHGYNRSLCHSLVSTEGAVYGITFLGNAEEERDEAVKFVMDGIASGWVNPYFGRKYKFDEAASAHIDMVTYKGSTGKLILVP